MVGQFDTCVHNRGEIYLAAAMLPPAPKNIAAKYTVRPFSRSFSFRV